MRIIFVLLVTLLFTFAINSQSKNNSISLNTGIFIPNTDLGLYNLGWNLGAEYQNSFKPWAFFAELNANLSRKKVYLDYYEMTNETRSFIELTAGPRYIFYGRNVQPFFDLGAGIYNVHYSRNDLHFGISTGIGAFININKEFDIILKAKYHPHIVTGDGIGIVDYFGIYGGVKYNF